jgi:hypothetical protein
MADNEVNTAHFFQNISFNLVIELDKALITNLNSLTLLFRNITLN